MGPKHLKLVTCLRWFPCVVLLYKLWGLILSFQSLNHFFFFSMISSGCFSFFFSLLRVKRDFNRRPANLALEQTKDPQEENGQNKKWSPPHLRLGTFPATSGQELLTVVLTSPHLTHLRKCARMPLGGGSMTETEFRVSWDLVSPQINYVALSKSLPLWSLLWVIHLNERVIQEELCSPFLLLPFCFSTQPLSLF